MSRRDRRQKQLDAEAQQNANRAAAEGGSAEQRSHVTDDATVVVPSTAPRDDAPTQAAPTRSRARVSESAEASEPADATSSSDATTVMPAAGASTGASTVKPPTKRDEKASTKDKSSRRGARKVGDDKPAPSTARRWLDRLILIAAVWAIWAFITTFVVQPFRIPSSSMENTLRIGDRMVVAKWSPRFSDVKRGDVIVFKDPGEWTDPVPSSNALVGAIRKVAEVTHLSASGSHLVKRVIGVGGDRVTCDGPGQKLKVNGAAINETYLKPGVQPCQDKFAITVPAKKVWVMGDNRSDSADSRYHDDGTGALGSVPVSDITGRSLAVIWPIGNIAGGHNDEGAFSKVPAAK